MIFPSQVTLGMRPAVGVVRVGLYFPCDAAPVPSRRTGVRVAFRLLHVLLARVGLRARFCTESLPPKARQRPWREVYPSRELRAKNDRLETRVLQVL